MKLLTASLLSLAALLASQASMAEESALMTNRLTTANYQAMQATRDKADAEQQTAQNAQPDAEKKAEQDKHC
ncbi:hypothetical protein N5J43_11325 [Pseudomonas nicosulfuronedens]|uniref:Secreted protein n=1 Tax=Pseudomonas nicosulfuronedens TaxID=2571105 RepID=A0A5R9RB68_9PSED|nr:hypothetical protein [Pseudomonas nicosulfuronedens]MDH1011023.1 hypothetical protein [Pseudomonas nicosulfuronedens]MDH1979546.1 hypothetical protein [Pseudomonas nicosulfuronedens]MDH2026793.1 hypothetical protein [Pseudomonas nicosulfuronedens]TLX79499.1 hypothetical protein FAS41_07440 [Pseudomonas nicosulfuronedens]